MDLFGLGAALAPGVTKLVGDIANRILPAEKMSEADKLRLQAEVQLAVMSADWRQVESEFSDRASARNLAASDVARGNAFTNVLAATVRPAWGYWCMGVVTILVAGKTANMIDPSPEILSLVTDIVKSVLFFFFGGRTVEKVTNAIVKRVKQ